MTNKSLALVVVAMALSCGPKPNPPPSNADVCIAAQENLLQLQCEDEGRLLGGPTKRGLSFKDFCEEMISEGVMTPQDAQCLSKVTDCVQVDVVCSWGG